MKNNALLAVLIVFLILIVLVVKVVYDNSVYHLDEINGVLDTGMVMPVDGYRQGDPAPETPECPEYDSTIGLWYMPDGTSVIAPPKGCDTVADVSATEADETLPHSWIPVIVGGAE